MPKRFPIPKLDCILEQHTCTNFMSTTMFLTGQNWTTLLHAKYVRKLCVHNNVSHMANLAKLDNIAVTYVHKLCVHNNRPAAHAVIGNILDL